MPDFEYRQTVVTLKCHASQPDAEARRNSGPPGAYRLRQGWKAVYSAREPDAATRETEQTLPPLDRWRRGALTEPRVEDKRTQAPPRYNEGTLIDAMQNAWRFVEDPAMRERLKEAKGIGTPATRAEIIKGLKRQNLLAADGKLVVPAAAGPAAVRTVARRGTRARRSGDNRGMGDAAGCGRDRQGGHSG